MGVAAVRQGQLRGHRSHAADPGRVEVETTLQLPDPPLGEASSEPVEVVPAQERVSPLEEAIDGAPDRLDCLDIAFDRPRS